MIIYPACIVPERCLQMAGKPAPYGQQLFQRIFLQSRVFCKKMIQIINVCLKMAVMVKVHGFLINIRLQRVIGVGQRCVDKWVIIVHTVSLNGFPDSI